MMQLLTLPPISAIQSVPAEEVPAEIARVAAIQAALAARLLMAVPSAAPRPATKCVTAKVLADALSLRVDRVYELARQGRLPFHRQGRTVPHADPMASYARA